MTDTELSERQESLMQWRDYFLLLREGLEQEPWFSEEYSERVDTWIQVVIAELESDVKHLQCNNEKFCRFEEPTNLTQIESNFNCADDGPTERFK